MMTDKFMARRDMLGKAYITIRTLPNIGTILAKERLMGPPPIYIDKNFSLFFKLSMNGRE